MWLSYSQVLYSRSGFGVTYLPNVKSQYLVSVNQKQLGLYSVLSSFVNSVPKLADINESGVFQKAPISIKVNFGKLIYFNELQSLNTDEFNESKLGKSTATRELHRRNASRHINSTLGRSIEIREEHSKNE